jgi:prepilin-type N-terminal cleavage/methylation domain-containing protein
VRRPTRDGGFTLPELLIAVVLMAMLASVVSMAIMTAMRNAPIVMSRTDTAVAVQGITTWLPPDVDSAEPGRFDTDVAATSGCAGTDPGTNILRLQWSETYRTLTTTFVANYRFVPNGTSARIVRLSCSGEFSLGAPRELTMSAPLALVQPTVTEIDSDGDAKTDQVRISIQTLEGETVFIEAATKNPNETLPPVPTDPPAPTTAPPANQPPVASPVTLVANPSTTVTFALSATDPEGGPLTASLTGLPPDWGATTNGTTVELTVGAATGQFVLGYDVADPAGATASSTVTVDVTTGALPTTTTTTTTTTIPICTVGGISVSPGVVNLQAKNTGKLKKDVEVTLSGVSGYCVGLTLQYVTGAPNGQYVQSFGDTAPYTVTLLGHPHGTELWSTGTKSLEVRDGFDRLLATGTLTITN